MSSLARHEMCLVGSVVAVASRYSGWNSNQECLKLVCESETRCNNNTNWDNITTLCSTLRTKVSCVVSKRLPRTGQYLVRLIEFEDGVRWVVHIPLDYTGPGSTASMTDRIMQKVATYKFLK